LSFAPQQLESASQRNVFVPLTVRRNRFTSNLYFFGLLGHRFEKQRSAIGISAYRADLNSLHTVDLLYPNAEAIEQGGSATDIRVGYLRELGENHHLQAVLVRSHVDMEHTVTYVDRIWDQRTFTWTASAPRDEFNEDNTTTLGAHIAYTRPLTDSKWRLSGVLTANAKDHPHIPNYTFMSIPRDPGNSWAFRFGGGAARVDSASTWALDFTYEPAWTSTWAVAGTQMKSVSGAIIPVGAPTVENEMVFSNSNYHFGWLHNFDKSFSLMTGLGIRHVRYWLDQYSHVTESTREDDSSWNELTLSGGVAFNVSRASIRYVVQFRGDADMNFASEDMVFATPEMGDIDVVAAPSSPMNMRVVPVIMHQFTVSIPIGHQR
jgi:hypothetical protein